MTTSHPVPADSEAETIIDLVHDCREISGVLGSFIPTEVRIPEARSGATSVEISSMVAAGLDGYDEYGS